MITIINLTSAISAAIEQRFGAPPITKDIDEGHPRPATYLFVVGHRMSRDGIARHEVLQFNLVRFAAHTTRGYLELIQDSYAVMDMLSSAPIRVTDTSSIDIDEINITLEKADMALLAEFSVELVQMIDIGDTGTTMDELDILGLEITDEMGDDNGTSDN